MTMKMTTLRAENAERIENLKQAVSNGRDDSETVLAAGSAKVASGDDKKPSPPDTGTL